MPRSRESKALMLLCCMLLSITASHGVTQNVVAEPTMLLAFYENSDSVPPFVSPSQSATTILQGNVSVETIEGPVLFEWRLFSPNVSSYTPGDFWTSFDIVCNVSNGFENVFVHFQDQEDPWNNSSVNFGSHLVSDVLTDDGEFLQYLAYRNSTYFFLNGSYNYLFYPQVDGTMLGNVSVTIEDEMVPIFDITILAETMFPSVDIIAPQAREESDIPYHLNMTYNKLIVNSSDPSGIRNASLIGIVESSGANLEYHFTSNSSVTSGSPYNLSLTPEDVQTYATLTEQTNPEIVIIDAFIEVDDTLGWRTRRFVKIRFDIRARIPEVQWDSPIIIATLSGLSIVALIVIVRFYRRRNT